MLGKQPNKSIIERVTVKIDESIGEIIKLRDEHAKDMQDMKIAEEVRENRLTQLKESSDEIIEGLQLLRLEIVRHHVSEADCNSLFVMLHQIYINFKGFLGL